MSSSGHVAIAHGRAQGFTLLEVLLAFVILSISLAVVFQIISGSVRNTVHSRQYTEITLIAQSVMDTVGLDIPLEPGSEVGGEWGDYQWFLEIYDYQGQQDGEFRALELADITGVNLLQVDLYVHWGEEGDERSRRFSTVKAVLPP
jgi:general secretion pathway protein I